jgi:hypothetical protein
MKNNKLTLKSLKQELENMKVKSGVKSNDKVENLPKIVGQDIKNSYIQRLYMRSGAFTLYLLTGILGYAHKIPFIGRIISLAAVWYGKTTIWKILVKLRKFFIVVNAILGVFVVFKSVGFTTDKLLIGFTAVGECYFLMLTTLVKRMFHWFVELFDHKIVPNVPGDNGGTWFSKPPKNNSIFTSSNIKIPNLLESDTFSLRNLYKDATISETPWYKDSKTLFWIVFSVVVVGVLYVSYQELSEQISFKPSINTESPTPPIDPDITLGGKMVVVVVVFSHSLPKD